VKKPMCSGAKKTPVENPARRLPEEWEWTIPIWTGYSAGVPSVKLSLSTGEGRYLDLPLVRQNEVVCRIVNNLTHLRAVACVYNGKNTPKTYLAWSESVRRRRRFGELVQSTPPHVCIPRFGVIASSNKWSKNFDKKPHRRGGECIQNPRLTLSNTRFLRPT